MNYHRVTPRDLFNESKLLKCLGFISLWILDNRLYPYKLQEYLSDEKKGFIIKQDPNDGSIFCKNYGVYIDVKGIGPFHLHFFHPLNDKRNFPLMLRTVQSEEIDVFTDDGKPSQDFLSYLKTLSEFKP